MSYRSLLKHLLLTAFILLTAVTGWTKSLPFEPGEKLYYEVFWGQVPVAQLSLAVQPIKQLAGEPAHHFLFKAQTKPGLNRLYPVNGHIEAFTDLELTRSLRLAKDMQEGRSQRIFQVDFDWTSGIATYANERKTLRRFTLDAGTLDMLSILYYARTLPLEAGLGISRPLASGKKIHQAQARVVRRETIAVDGRPWEAFLLETDIRKAGGVFKKSRHATLSLWISADERRIPLRVVSKVGLGSFLIEYTGASPASDKDGAADRG